MPTSDEEFQQHRWQLLRWAPRHDSGVLYFVGHEGELWVDGIAEYVPFLVSTGDFAPADMQYRMHREHLWTAETGLYGEAFNVDAGTWVRQAATASGNAKAALGIAEALRLGGDGTPAEMRARWQRQTRELLVACAAAGFANGDLDRAAEMAAADGWLT